jgi:hypothetical protein
VPEPSHDEAVDALLKIRQASDLADIAERIAFNAKCEAKSTKLVAEIAASNARCVARAQSRPLPLFDQADGITPDAPRPKGRGKSKTDPEPAPAPEPVVQPLPWEDTLVSELPIPEEAVDALKSFRIVTVGLMVKFMKAGCDWAIIPGMDPGAAARIDSALIDFLDRNRARDGEEGKAA